MTSYLTREFTQVGNGRKPVNLSVGERDGERRYGKELWLLASVRLNYEQVSHQYGHLKVWREGKESSDQD